MDDANNLWDEYLATEYRADSPLGPISISIGELTLLLDVLLDSYEVLDWAFITAQNPGSRRLSAGENELRQQSLHQDIARRGLPMFPGSGVDRDPSCTPEESLLPLGITHVDEGRSAAITGKTLWSVASLDDLLNSLIVG